MTKLPPTVVRLKHGQILTDEDRITLLAQALITHYHDDFTKMEPDLREKVAIEMARRLVEMANRCAQSHRTHDLAHYIELAVPSQEECAAFEDLVKDVIVFQEMKAGWDSGRTSRAVKYAVGVTWKNLRSALGLPEIQEERYTGNVAGPRG